MGNIRVTDMVPMRQPNPWTRISNYLVHGAEGLMVCPWILGLRHKGCSTVFDARFYRDAADGINRADKYIKNRH